MNNFDGSHSPRKKRKAAVISCVLIAALLIAGSVGGLIWHNRSRSNESAIITDKNYTSFSEGFTDVRITDEVSALEAVASVAPALGITDVQKELKVISVNTVDGDSYYRMQQYYNGIPVYGRDAIIAVDANGNAEALTSNITAISGNISENRDDIDTDKIIESTLDHDTILYKYDPNDIQIYISDSGEAELIKIIDVTYLYEHQLYSKKLMISLRDQKIIRSDDNLHSNIEAQDKFDPTSHIELSGETSNGSFLLKDDTRNITCIYIDDLENISIDRDTLNDSNEEHTQTYKTVQKTYDFFKNTVGISSFDNKNSPTVVAICDESILIDQCKSIILNFTDDNVFVAFLLIGKPVNKYTSNLGAALDIVGHEYMHNVIHNIVLLDNNGIEEGLCDIFGNLNEFSYDGDRENVWQLGETAGHYKYDMSDNITMDAYDESTADGHGNAAILSHAAYLMWNGIDGHEDMKIASDKLAKLWYRSLFMLNSDATFSQCRNAVELSAKIMMKNGELSDKQYETVTNAFESVGIKNASYTYEKTVRNEFDLSVLSSQETENVNFGLKILKMSTNDVLPPVIINTTAVNGRQHLTLENGIYLLQLRDLADRGTGSKMISVKIIVDGGNKNASDSIVINTDFTDIITVVLDGNTSDGPEDTVNVYSEYLKIIEGYEEKYGEIRMDNDQPLLGSLPNLLEGLCYAELIDFDGNGTEELLLFYGIVNSASCEYTYEVWAYENGEIVKVFSDKPLYEEQAGPWRHIDLKKKDGKTYLINSYLDYYSYDRDFYFTDFYEYAEANFRLVKSIAEEEYARQDPICMIDGIECSWDEYASANNEWYKNRTVIMLSNDNLNAYKSQITETKRLLMESLGMDTDELYENHTEHETEVNYMNSEDIISALEEHYQNSLEPLALGSGSYKISNGESIEKENEYLFVLRYYISDEEAQWYLNNGMTPGATTGMPVSITVNKTTGEVTDDAVSSKPWYLW